MRGTIRYNDDKWYGGIDLAVNYILENGVLTVLHEGSFIHHNPAKDAEEIYWDEEGIPYKWSRYESPFVDLDFHTAIIEPGFKEIEADFFTGCRHLKRVEIPETIEKIHIDFARGVELEYYNENGLLFLGNDRNRRHFLMGCAEDFRQEHLMIPEGTNFVFCGAFEDKNFIKTVSFPYSLKTIWNNAFRNTDIKELEIPAYGIGENEEAGGWYWGFCKDCLLRSISVPFNHYRFYVEHKDWEHVDWWHAFPDCKIIFRNPDGSAAEFLPPDPNPRFNWDNCDPLDLSALKGYSDTEDEEDTDDSFPF